MTRPSAAPGVYNANNPAITTAVCGLLFLHSFIFFPQVEQHTAESHIVFYVAVQCVNFHIDLEMTKGLVSQQQCRRDVL